ncbi:MAG TPA: AEC family transporter [Capsulimonadaceae bacterium]|nr:AEC family transporter [Capsulimonadaceae bacterium]
MTSSALSLASLWSTGEPILIAVLKVAAVAAVGYVIARRGLLHEAALKDISSLVVQLTVPCLIFTELAAGISGIRAEGALLLIVAGPLLLAVGWAIGHGLFRLAKVQSHLDRPVIGAITFQNAQYMPLAVATAVIPSLAPFFPGMPPGSLAGVSVICIFLFCVLYSPVFWGVGFWWLLGGSNLRQLPLIRLLPPPVIGILLGYLFGLTPLHLALTPPTAPLHFFYTALSDIGGITVPLANLVLGGMLAVARNERREGVSIVRRRDRICVIFGKLILLPLLVYLVLLATRSLWIGAGAGLTLALFVILLEAASPPATNLAVMGGSAKKRVTGLAISELLMSSYLAALITVPLWLILFLRLLAAK